MPKQNLAQVIIDDILSQIARGELQPGDTLPIEPELCERYGMSRSAVREAVHKLAGKGFVTVRQGSGTRVTPRDRWNELDADYLRCGVGEEGMPELAGGHLMEARDALEPVLAGWAAERATPEDRARLRGLLDQQVEAGARDLERFGDIDIAFHTAIAEATHNPLLVAMHAALVTLGHRSRSVAAQVPGSPERTVVWHTHMMEAIEAADPQAAQDAMRMHMRQVRSELHRAKSAAR
ncbi:FadR/GntR family transcriptional regulator [Streptosporangium sp. NPDC000396]|uniref:FadR/GntR family transcriptional regulator n=1 Tax=Streptosporangium sp. NPDC000396 TaxID=3366185 RepID=UPI003693B881